MQSEQEDELETTLSWEASGRSVLKLNIRHLYVFGLWPLCEAWPFHLYTAYGAALGIWNTAEGFLAVYFSWGDLEQTTLVLMNTFTNASGLVKIAFFARDGRRYNSLARSVDRLMSLQSGVCSRDPALAGVVRRSRQSATRLTLGMLLFMFSQCFVWFPMPVFAHAGERRLPFAQHPWDNNTGYYELSYAVQCVAGLWLSQISYGIDCLFASVMLLVAAQLEILAGRIVALGKVANAAGCRPDESLAANTRNQTYRDLCVCVEAHQKVLRFVTHLENTMSPIAMTQFVCSVLVACSSLFQATYSKDLSAAFSSMSFLPIPGGQVYLYCWAAHTVTEQAQMISAAAYGCSWVEESERFKHAMRILINRAQKPLVLTAGHLYPIDKPAFLSLVNASYSYYALLGQMNKR
ncbi:odorant receptor Or2-like [Schistocerca gregaria]|uniref:odorant receptor Or2-like n=1 Tax=Schistocerca gregaria TaxID=7010 RepID=UPI00211EBA97|nr:odorant receptor Or2-like [Schistocerca gregaria]